MSFLFFCWPQKKNKPTAKLKCVNMQLFVYKIDKTKLNNNVTLR